MQIVAAVRGVCSGTAEKFIDELAAPQYSPQVSDLLEKLADAAEQLKKVIAFVKEQGTEYMDLYGRAIVDIAIDLINGYLLCGQAGTNVQMQVASAGEGNGDGQMIPIRRRKELTARRYVTKNAPKIAALARTICMGDKSTFSDDPAIVGPVSAE